MRIIETQLPIEKDAVKKSELYYLKSLVSDSEDEKLQALRSALFEDLQNIEALMGITRLYLETGDIRKAFRYIKQAAALDPENLEILNELETNRRAFELKIKVCIFFISGSLRSPVCGS